tara:strand:+ start:2710 stop:3447 length:738 start_codon:yes stop_codon:yes gene_type:complete
VSKFNKNGNNYIITYAVIMTLVFGSVLAVIAMVLKPKQDMEVLLEKQNFILKAALGEDAISLMTDEEVSRLYAETVVTDVVKSSGDIVETEEASVNVFKEYKKPKDIRNLPVYTIYGTKEKKNVVSYVFPVYGKGLWDFIWGYVAVKSDLETVSGVVFDHKGETPGLGARITDAEVQSRFAGKKIVDAKGNMSIPYFEKGEGNDYSNMPQQVDGLSGATITANGVSSMLKSYLLLYKPFILSRKK